MAIVYNNRGMRTWPRANSIALVADYDQSLKFDRTYATAFISRGAVCQKKDDYDRAIEQCNESIRLNLDCAGASANRAESFERKGDHEHAIHDYDEAIRPQPAITTSWNGRCWARAILRAALADCNAAVRLAPIPPRRWIRTDLRI